MDADRLEQRPFDKEVSALTTVHNTVHGTFIDKEYRQGNNDCGLRRTEH